MYTIQPLSVRLRVGGTGVVEQTRQGLIPCGLFSLGGGPFQRNLMSVTISCCAWQFTKNEWAKEARDVLLQRFQRASVNNSAVVTHSLLHCKHSGACRARHGHRGERLGRPAHGICNIISH